MILQFSTPTGLILNYENLPEFVNFPEGATFKATIFVVLRSSHFAWLVQAQFEKNVHLCIRISLSFFAVHFSYTMGSTTCCKCSLAHFCLLDWMLDLDEQGAKQIHCELAEHQ